METIILLIIVLLVFATIGIIATLRLLFRRGLSRILVKSFGDMFIGEKMAIKTTT